MIDVRVTLTDACLWTDAPRQVRPRGNAGLPLLREPVRIEVQGARVEARVALHAEYRGHDPRAGLERHRSGSVTIGAGAAAAWHHVPRRASPRHLPYGRVLAQAFCNTPHTRPSTCGQVRAGRHTTCWR